MSKIKKLWRLPREIRIQTPNKIGQIVTGYNEQRGISETWKVIKVAKNYNDNIMELQSTNDSKGFGHCEKN